MRFWSVATSSFYCLGWLAMGVMLMMQPSCKTNQSNPDHVTWADSVSEHFRTLMNGDKPLLSLTYIDSIYRVTPGRGIGDYWRKYSVKVEYYTTIEVNQQKKQLYIDSMQTLLKGREFQYKYEYGHNLFLQGDLFLAEKKYSRAFQCYYDGRNFAGQNLDGCSLSDFSNCIANVYYNQGYYSKAISMMKQSLKECGNCTVNNFQYSFASRQAALNTIALCFEKWGKADSAAAYYLKAIDFIEKNAKNYPQKAVFTSTARGVIEGNLGGLYSKQQKYDEAITYMQRSIKNNDREKYAIEDAQLTKIKLATLYVQLNRFNDAKKLINELHLDLVSGRGKSLAHNDVKSKWYRLSWIYYDKLRQIPEAYKFQNRYYTFTDSINLNRNTLKNTDLDQAFKVHDQQFQLTLLGKNDELKTSYLVGAILFLILVTIIAFITNVNLKRSRKNIAALTSLNAQMKNTLVALENSQADNSRMMAIVAHDLRNPISAISTAAAFMLDEGNHSEDDNQMLELIKASGKNSLELVNELLQVNAAPGQLGKEPVNLADLIQYCVDLLSHRAADKNQQLILNAEAVTANVNQEKMWRVISNLVGNAIKFSPEGTAINIRLYQQKQNAIIEVKDQGIGIPDGIKNKIFAMASEAKRTGTAGEESFGLGLAISKQIVEGHGGKIWFESGANGGTAFFVELPV